MVPKERIISLVVVSFMVLCTLLVFVPEKTVGIVGSTLYVGGSGPGNYTTVQSAINNASNGDTVFVYSGIYYEVVAINKTIRLLGEDKDSTIIKGPTAGIVIISHWVNLSGFTITNNSCGISLSSSSGNNTITGNTIASNNYGIQLRSSNSNAITGNIITSNNNNGIYFDSSNNNTITGNTIANNNFSIYSYSSSSNAITGNTIANNSYGIFLYSSNSNKIYHNNFRNNSKHATTAYEGANDWDNGNLSGGNYWDNYNGIDADSDGIGDTPYPILGGTNQDRYPLMSPYSLTINQQPTCALSANHTNGPAPLTVTFTLSASDPDGTITSWTLDVDNDGTIDYSGSGSPPSTQQHTYTNNGVYIAHLTVTDNNATTDTDAVTITVSVPGNQPPVCSLSVTPTSGPAPLTVVFTMSASDPDGTITAWTLDIDSDGITAYRYSGSGNPPSVQQHTYQTARTYTAKLTVTDNQNDTASDTTVITVNQPSSQNQPPVAGFTYSRDGRIVTFTHTSTDSDGSITSWYWDFGDENYSVASSPIHEYGEGGDYTVKLTVTDDDGATDSITQVITVEKDDDGIPGFEMVLLVVALISLLTVIRKKR